MRAVPCVFTAIAVALVVLSRASSQAGPSNAPAVAAARTRQESVKTVNLVLKQTEVFAKGGVSDRTPPPFKSKAPVPAKETTLESINRLVLDGEKVRYEDNHPGWHMPSGEQHKRRVVSLFNGSVAKKYFPSGVSGKGNPVGTIDKDAWQDAMKSAVLTPITMAFRGLDLAISPYLIGDLKPSGITLPIDGAPCQEHVVNFSDATKSFWLDPGKDYVVRRMRLQRRGHLVDQCDISYRRHDAWGWVPASWVRNQYSPAGTVLVTTKVEVLEMRLNDPQPAEQFDIQFPAGSQVFDIRNAKNYRVQPDGTMRELSPSGEELPGSVPQPGDPWYRRNKWLLLSLGVVLAALVLPYAMRRKRANAA
jgi:hypothetical protein